MSNVVPMPRASIEDIVELMSLMERELEAHKKACAAEVDELRSRVEVLEERPIPRMRGPYKPRGLSEAAVRLLHFMHANATWSLTITMWRENAPFGCSETIFQTLLSRGLIESPAKHRFRISEKGIHYIESLHPVEETE